MNNFYSKFRNWCYANIGPLTFFTGIIILYSVLPLGQIDFTKANSFFAKVVTILFYKIPIPTYLLILVIVLILLYLFRLKRKYSIQTISASFLKGTWKNEWTINGHTDSEILVIDKDLHYFLKGEHTFDIQQFSFDPAKKEMKFEKVAVKPDDDRKHKNVLSLINNDVLIGDEDYYKIKYARLTD